MVQPIGTKYQTSIPLLSDNADIQTALKVYHYGQATEPGTLVANSIAGHLNNLEITKVDIIPEQVVLGTGNNLNSKITTGYYSIATNAIASAGSNYPPAATAGMLHVMNDGSGIIYQVYVSNTPKLYWRAFFSSVWTAWREASDTTHSHAEFGTLAGQIATKQDTITGAATSVTTSNLTTNRVLVSDGSGKIAVSTNVTSTELNNLDGTTGIVPSLAGTVGGDGTSKKIFIQEATPTGTSAGDLWFW